MKRNYKLTPKLVASMLLISLFLQSCGNSFNQLALSEKESINKSLISSRYIDFNPLIGKKLTAEKGYLVTFHKQDGKLRADIKVGKTKKGSNYKNLPVAIEKGTDLVNLVKLDPKLQQRRIQLERAQCGQPDYVKVFRGGLLGGMKKEDEQQGQKSKSMVREKKGQQKVSNHKEKDPITGQNNNQRATGKEAITQKTRPGTDFPKGINEISSCRKNYQKKGDQNESNKKKPRRRRKPRKKVGVDTKQTESSSTCKDQKQQKGPNEQGEKEIDADIFKQRYESLGTFQVFPLELLQMIFFYVEYPYILNCIKINYCFYEFITGYNQIGLVGLANKPNPVLYSNRWVKDKLINFKERNFNKVPSFIFYRIIGKIKSLPKNLWPYLSGTQIHTLSLSSNHIGATGASELAKVLPSTNIHTLRLYNNCIEAAGARSLAEALPNTKIHTLRLRCNEIRALGATALAKALPSTHIHTIDLSCNQIGDTGVTELAKVLPHTQVHTINLELNKIKDTGAIALAKALPYIQVHILELGANKIGDAGVTELARALPHTQVHTIHLDENKISTKMKLLLTQQYPNIKWNFTDVSF